MNTTHDPRRLFCGWMPRLLSIFVLVAVCCLALPVRADDDEKEEDKGPAKPENVTLTTRDNLALHCTYYPGEPSKDTVPVILLHGWKGQRGEMDGLATYLQSLGHAVIVPDLRGHGKSTKIKRPNRDRDEEIKIERNTKAHLFNMITNDLEAVKKFLLKKNNKGELNIELLCVVGADMGANVALNWAVQDWSWPQLPTIKQGQDVKAVVLITPSQSFKGLTFQAVKSHPTVRGGKVSKMIVVGSKDRQSFSEAKRLYSSLKRFHSIPSDPKEQKEKQDIFFVPLDTSLQGIKLLRGVGLDQKIAGFIQLRLVDKKSDYPWKNRERP